MTICVLPFVLEWMLIVWPDEDKIISSETQYDYNDVIEA
jgi:hypothetical protein